MVDGDKGQNSLDLWLFKFVESVVTLFVVAMIG